MNLLNLLSTASRQLLRNKVRTFLTTLGIIIGVSSVIVMIAIGSGSKESIRQTISSLGTNVIIIFPGSQRQGGVRMEAGSSQRLTLQDASAIRNGIPQVKYASPIVQTRVQAVSGAFNHRTSLIGAYPEYFNIRTLGLNAGDYFSMSDNNGINKVCVIGQTVVNELFGEGASPIGQVIRLNNVPFRIAGILDKKGQNTFGQDQDDLIIAPFATVQKRMMPESTMGLQQILVSASREDVIEKATDEISVLLRQRHKIQEGEEDDFSVRTQSEFASIMNSTTAVMSMLLTCIAVISLLVGGIGIMNIMLVSVTERTREIGIRMAIGAKERVIMLQFLIEAIIISLAGGVIGIIIGYGISSLIAISFGWAVKISLQSVLLSFLFSTLIGVFFGWYPAKKAARLNPIEALRYE